MCAIETALPVDEVLGTFTATLSTNPVGRGWVTVGAEEYDGVIADAIGIAAADPAPIGRAPRLVCVVIAAHSNHRRQVYVGAVPGTPPGLLGAIFAARQITRTGRVLVRHDGKARWEWASPTRSPLTQLAASD